MSGVKVIRYLLANNAPLIAEVPAGKIMAGVIAQETALPAIAINHVSTVVRNTLSASATQFYTSRVQVTVFAPDYVTQKSVLELVKAAIPRTRGTINGVSVDSILRDMEGPDFHDDNGEVFMQSHDFIVMFNA